MRLIDHILAVVLVIAFTLTIAGPRSAAFAADPAFQVPVGQRQLFLDDVGIAKIENLTRTMHQPIKKGAVIRPDPVIGEQAVQTRSAPSWDTAKNKFTFFVMRNPGRGITGYFESKDGLHWSQPEMGQIEFRGSRKNNFVSVMIDGQPYRIDYVVYDPTDPDPYRRYKGWVALVKPGYKPFKQPVVSDGIRWQVLDVPVIPSDVNDGNLSFDLKNHLFIGGLEMWGDHGRAWAVTTSSDFENWSKPELVFQTDELDQKLARKVIKAHLADPTLQQPFYNDPDTWKVDVYNMGIFRYEGFYIGIPALFYNTGPIPKASTDGFFALQLACSRDLKDWKRLGDRKAFMGPSRLGSGAYDRGTMLCPSNAIVRHDELWFYYTGAKTRAGAEYSINSGTLHDPVSGESFFDDSCAVCLAALRRDGFISLNAGEQAGMIQSEPFKLPGTKLFVNVDAPKGDLHVELLNGDGKVVAKSKSLTGDLLREPVTWAEGDIADFKGHIASLRFTLRNGQFYSYWLE